MSDRRQPKPWYQSRTVWFNLLGLMAFVLVEIQKYIGTNLPNAPEWLENALASGVFITNLVLRFFSTQRVAITKSDGGEA
jgi:hypothetical protein